MSPFLIRSSTLYHLITSTMALLPWLSSTEILFSIPCLLLLLFYYRHYFSKFRNSTIPIYFPVVGMIPGLLLNLRNFHGWATRILHESRCNFLFSGLDMNIFLTCDPSNIQHIFTSNFQNYPKGEEFFEIFDILGDGIFNSDAEKWLSQRIKAQHLMSHARFRSYVAKSIKEKTENALLPLLVHAEKNGQDIDLQDIFLRLTFDSTTTLVFGLDPGCLSIDLPTIPFAQAMDDAMGVLFIRHALPPFFWKILRKLNIRSEKKLANAWKVIDHFIEETIERRREEKKEETECDAFPDLLSSYIDDNETGKINKYLRDTTVNLMLAGRDTTGSGLSWFFWLLTQNPDVERKVLDELKSIPHTLTSDGLAIFNSDDLAKLTYLHAALCESLRLFPPVPFEHKGALKPDMLPSGHIANPGVKILISTYSMGRMEDVWGKDCTEFKPERWINEKGKSKYEPSYKFLSFNSGPRTCLGKDVAFTQMKAVAAALVYNFCFEVIKGHVVEPKLSIILHMANGLMVKVKKRDLATV
ncbi:hypothetical protein LUZ60_014972 [Juncus effusus]|nr:hypothetical protein LUZ60_014972 [Juncus effusus]